jgi:hypothetical protein
MNDSGNRRIATLGDLGSSSNPAPGGYGHAHDGGDDDNEGEGDPQTFFAGGGERRSVHVILTGCLYHQPQSTPVECPFKAPLDVADLFLEVTL